VFRDSLRAHRTVAATPQRETLIRRALESAGLTIASIAGIMGHGGGDRRGAASFALESYPFNQLQLELFPESNDDHHPKEAS